MPARRGSLAWLIVPPLCLGLLGFCCGGLARAVFPSPRTVETRHVYPLPHHLAKYPGNLSFRFAMVHDVIHERFPHHGPDYYRARNREVQEALAKQKPPTARGQGADEYFRRLDDLGVGLEFLGQHQQAVDLMRDKLKKQEALGYKDKELYSTYANLGTFLILWQLGEGVKDVPKAKERIGESVAWIRKAIAVYPQSHFGRESWQLVLEEFLLAVLDDPQLLLRYDMIGDRLDRAVDAANAICFDKEQWLEAGNLAGAAIGALTSEPDQNLTGVFRACIQRVGAEEGWREAVKTSLEAPAPFDEPALGIVGMWRMGAGANPHFALALGEIMLRVGQGYVAWTAYERAHQMREHYWPDPAIQQRFGEHCRARQRLIESVHPREDWAAVRRKFEEELAFGQQYQKDYKDYEARQIQEGRSVYDAQFYQAFEQGREPIATPPGEEERTYGKTVVTRLGPSEAEDVLSHALMVGGAVAFVTALAQTFWRTLRPT